MKFALAKRPHVYMKLSAIIQDIGGKVSTDLAPYKDWLDRLWDCFGEDRVLFGSNWPASDNIELKSYPNLMKVTREYVTAKGPSAMEKVFWRNSISAYRWVKRDASQPQT